MRPYLILQASFSRLVVGAASFQCQRYIIPALFKQFLTEASAFWVLHIISRAAPELESFGNLYLDTLLKFHKL